MLLFFSSGNFFFFFRHCTCKQPFNRFRLANRNPIIKNKISKIVFFPIHVLQATVWKGLFKFHHCAFHAYILPFTAT